MRFKLNPHRFIQSQAREARKACGRGGGSVSIVEPPAQVARLTLPPPRQRVLRAACLRGGGPGGWGRRKGRRGLPQHVDADGVGAPADADGGAEDDDDALAGRAEAAGEQSPVHQSTSSSVSCIAGISRGTTPQ